MQDLNDKINNGGATAQGQLSADEWNEIPSEIQAVITSVGQALSGGDLTQLVKAIVSYSANGNFFADSGIADAYVLTALGAKQGLYAYGDGSRVAFVASFDNTGAATVNVSTLGVKDIKLSNGDDLSAGDITADEILELVYDLANDYFVLLRVLTDSVYKDLKADSPNILINGGMDVWQRGTSFPAGGVYTADRWRSLGSTSVSRNANTPLQFLYSLEMTGTGGNVPAIFYGIELGKDGGQSVMRNGGTYTISGYMRSEVSLQALSLLTNWQDEVASPTNTVSDFPQTTIFSSTLVGTAQYFEYTFESAASPVSTNLSYTISLRGTQSDGTILLSGLKLEEGTTATPYQARPIGEELSLCQRYYRRIDNTASLGDSAAVGIGALNTATQTMCDANHPTSMRVPPALEISAGNAMEVQVAGSILATTGITLFAGGNLSNTKLLLTHGANTAGRGARCRLTSSNTAYVAFNSEL